MSDIKERLDRLKSLMKDPDFLTGKGLSNEVNIRMFCYDAKEEMIVRHFVKQIKEDESIGQQIKVYNLYEIFLSICDKKKITKTIPSMEDKKGKAFILKQLEKLASNKQFVDKMLEEQLEKDDMIVLTGVGEVFPFLRVHLLLDAMQPYFTEQPIIVLYPGTFDGRFVKLFDKLPPGPYYRAFKEA